MPKTFVNGVNLYYELHGVVDSPLLVLNNGILMNAATSWVFQTATLSRHYRLLQYDCRGQGQSDHPESQYSMNLHADDLAALMDNLDISRAHMAGISYGGEVAQAFTLRYPERTQSLILADTVSEIHEQLAYVTQGWIDALQTQDAEIFFNATVPWNFSPKFIRENLELMEEAKKRYALLDFPSIIRLCESFLEVDFTSQLQQITAPTCIIVGSEDKLKGPEYADILHAGITNSELHFLPGAGHATCWERAPEFNTIILGFLAKQKEISM